MTAAAIRSRIAYGRAKAAQVLGDTYSIYRPSDAGNTAFMPLGVARGTLPAIFSSKPDSFSAPKLNKTPFWYGEFDTTQTQPGDILTGIAGTWFVWSQQEYVAPVCIGGFAASEWVRSVSVLMPVVSYTDGVNGYSGATPANELLILANWPAVILLGGRGEASPVKLPGDVRVPAWLTWMPVTPGVTIPHGAVVIDDLGRRFTVMSAELTDGWQLQCQQEVA